MVPAKAIDGAPPPLALRGVRKRFGETLACDNASIELRAGEIHALLGENGAGKSTLMSVAYGLYRPDAGEIAVRGERALFRTPADAIAAGLGMVHQHFMLVPTLTALENLVLGCEPTRGLWRRLDRAAARRSFLELRDRFQFDLEPDVLVGKMSVGERQRLEILKTLHRGARTLLLDEPTAVLTPQEADRLFELARALAGEGVAILLTSHKLEEVLACGDRYTVMRDGAVVGTGLVSEATRESLVRLMVGRDVNLDRRDARRSDGAAEPLLRLANVSTSGRSGRPLDGVSLEARPGEILGVAGVDGNGQNSLEAVVAGWTSPSAGEVLLAGERIDALPPLERLARGLAIVAGDRHHRAVALELDLRENLLLGYTDNRLREWKGGPRGREAVAHAAALVERFNVQPPSPRLPMRSFSGGNQQKAVVARAIAAKPRVLLAVNPTRGVDVGAIERIHQELRALRDAGAAILLVTTELNEILALADRVQVLFKGKLSAPMPGEGADSLALGELMTGGRRGDAA